MPRGKALSDRQFEDEVQIRARDLRTAINDASPEMKALLTETTILRRRQVRRNR